MAKWLVVVALLGCQTAIEPAPTDATGGDGAGTFHEQTLVVDGESRTFWLHVPASALAGEAALVVDFHGTGFTDLEPEIEWGTDELIAASDDIGFVVARPRSHSFTDSGQTLYQWDHTPAEVEANRRFAVALVEHISSHYSIDPSRVYASGFSNGTNMALQTLQLANAPFRGIALVGGGIYTPFPIVWPDAAPRIYATTGYRDLNFVFQRDLTAWLGSTHYPLENLWIRETAGLHELRGAQYREAFAWIDRGARPPVGELAAGWQAEATPAAAPLLSITSASSGTLIVTASDGSIWRRDATGTWTRARTPASGSPAVVAACIADGRGLATGEHVNLATTDDGVTWQPSPPTTVANEFGDATTFCLACGLNQRILAGGLGFGASSSDGGATWSTAAMPGLDGFTSGAFAIRRGTSGAYVAVGVDYAGRSTDGTTFTASTGADAYLYDVAEADPGHWVAVGNDGAMLASDDDGRTWTKEPTVTAQPLFAVSFASPTVGLAVGLHGTALVTHDGGTTWQHSDLGVDAMLADVRWLPSGQALVVGEGVFVTR